MWRSRYGQRLPSAALRLPIVRIRAVSKERLEQCMGALSPEHLEAVEQGVREVLEPG
jgi:hypothetical protein